MVLCYTVSFFVGDILALADRDSYVPGSRGRRDLIVSARHRITHFTILEWGSLEMFHMTRASAMVFACFLHGEK